MDRGFRFCGGARVAFHQEMMVIKDEATGRGCIFQGRGDDAFIIHCTLPWIRTYNALIVAFKEMGFKKLIVTAERKGSERFLKSRGWQFKNGFYETVI